MLNGLITRLLREKKLVKGPNTDEPELIFGLQGGEGASMEPLENNIMPWEGISFVITKTWVQILTIPYAKKKVQKYLKISYPVPDTAVSIFGLEINQD